MKATQRLLLPLAVCLALAGQSQAVQVSADSAGSASPANPQAVTALFLPIILAQRDVQRVNAPYLPATNIVVERFDEMAIFWFGQVTPTDNYVDVRIGYSATALELRLTVFDRRLWYDTTPTSSTLADWDTVTLYLNLDGTGGTGPGAQAYQLVAQLSAEGLNRAAYQAAYRGNGTGWNSAIVPFTTTPGWRGDALNNNLDDRAWVMEYRIPFASLGFASPPAPGTLWGLGLAVHDRDDSPGTPIAAQLWPESLDPGKPIAWGQLRFGLPAYAPPPTTGQQTLTVREGLGGATVPDAAVGGTTDNLCPGDSYHIWNVWGNANYGSSPTLNIQNQADVADWPCFAKYYVTFPITSIPVGKTVVSATLTLHHWGNSGSALPGQGNSAQASYVHVLTVPTTWAESTITWNNAPRGMENVSQAWVPVNTQCFSTLSWPCVPRTWDVSYAVANAYAAGSGFISFALYSTDSAYHSGKFFTTSETGDWNAVGRPTLSVTWGTP